MGVNPLNWREEDQWNSGFSIQGSYHSIRLRPVFNVALMPYKRIVAKD